MAGEKRTELADARTDLAEDRTLLANERTFAGWTRTALAAIGVALGFNALFKTLEPAWLPKAVSTALLLIAISVMIMAERRARAVSRRLNGHDVETFKAVNLRLLMLAVVAASLALTAAIWLLI